MNQELPQTNEVFIDMMIKKQEQQDQKIQAQAAKISSITEVVKSIPDYAGDFQEVKERVEAIKTVVEKIYFPTKEMQEFSARLTLAVELLRQPVEAKVEHHHHVPKIIFIAAALFIVLSLACAGWYRTASDSDQYKANDIKYRYLKLTGNSALLEQLFQSDSLYKSRYAMKDSVIQWEEDERKAVELNEQFRQKEGEGTEIKDKLDAVEKKNKGRKKS